MTYTSPTWVDVPPGTTPPAGAPALDAANLQPLTDTVAALAAAGGGSGGTVSAAFTIVGPKTSNYIAAAGEFVLWDTTATSLNMTLPSGAADKTIFGAKIVTLGAGHTVTINRSGSDVFGKAGGPTSVTLSLLDQAYQFEYVSASGVWVITGVDLTVAQLATLFGPLPSGTPTVGQVPSVNTVSPLALGWTNPGSGGGGSSLTPTATKSANYSAGTNELIPVDLSGGSVTITLPATPVDKSQVMAYIEAFAGTNVLTISRAGSDVIEQVGGTTGNTATRSSGAGQIIWLQYDSASTLWRQLPDRIPLSLLQTLFAAPSYVDTGDASNAAAIAVNTSALSNNGEAVNIYTSSWPNRPTGFKHVTWIGPASPAPFVYRQFSSATISTGTALTATGAAFTAADVGAPVTGTGIPGATTITVVTDATHATLSATSTNASGLTITVAPNGLQELDEYQVVS